MLRVRNAVRSQLDSSRIVAMIATVIELNYSRITIVIAAAIVIASNSGRIAVASGAVAIPVGSRPDFDKIVTKI